MSRQQGFSAEERARTYLSAQGLVFVESNYACNMGEIDIIMCDGSTLVFVEVRERNSLRYGSALESISYQKQKKLIKTAMYYLLKKPKWRDAPVRFDVVGITGDALEWVQDAFRMM